MNTIDIILLILKLILIKYNFQYKIVFSIFIAIVLSYIKINLNCDNDTDNDNNNNNIQIKNDVQNCNSFMSTIDKLEIELDEIDINSLYYVIKNDNDNEHKKEDIYKKLEQSSYKDKIKLIKKIIILLDIIHNLEINIKERIFNLWNNNYDEIIIGFNMINNDNNMCIDHIQMTEFINKEKNLLLAFNVDVIKNLLVLQGLYVTRYNFLLNQVNDNKIINNDNVINCLSYLELPFYISLIKQRLTNIYNDSVIEYSSTENLYEYEYNDNIFDGNIIEIISDINEVLNFIKSFRYNYINDYKIDIIYTLDIYLELNDITNNNNFQSHVNNNCNSNNIKFTFDEIINIWIKEKIILNNYKIKNNQKEKDQFNLIFNLNNQLHASNNNNNNIIINDLKLELEECKNNNLLSLSRAESLKAIVKISDLNSKNTIYKENQIINEEIISDLHLKIIDLDNQLSNLDINSTIIINDNLKLKDHLNKINKMNSYLINENSELLDRLLLMEKIDKIENKISFTLLNDSNKVPRNISLIDNTRDADLNYNKSNENIENNDNEFGLKLLMEFERDINNSCFDSIYCIKRQYNDYISSNEDNITILINKINELTDNNNNLFNINNELSNKIKKMPNEYLELINNKDNNLINKKQKSLFEIDQVCKSCENDIMINKEISLVINDIKSNIVDKNDKQLIHDIQLDLEITSNQLMENYIQINSLNNSISNIKLILQSTEIKLKESINNSDQKDKIIEKQNITINNLKNSVKELSYLADTNINLINSNKQFENDIKLYKESIINMKINLEDSILSNDALNLKLDQINKLKEQNTINYNESIVLINKKIQNLEALNKEKSTTYYNENEILKNKIQELSSIIKSQEFDLKQYKSNVKDKYSKFNSNNLQISSPISDDILVEKSKFFDIFHSPVEDKNYRILSPCSNNTLKKPYNSIQFNSIRKTKLSLNSKLKLVLLFFTIYLFIYYSDINFHYYFRLKMKLI